MVTRNTLPYFKSIRKNEQMLRVPSPGRNGVVYVIYIVSEFDPKRFDFFGRATKRFSSTKTNINFWEKKKMDSLYIPTIMILSLT